MYEIGAVELHLLYRRNQSKFVSLLCREKATFFNAHTSLTDTTSFYHFITSRAVIFLFIFCRSLIEDLFSIWNLQGINSQKSTNKTMCIRSDSFRDEISFSSVR